MEESFGSESSSSHSRKRLRYHSSDYDSDSNAEDLSGGTLHIDLDRFIGRRPSSPSPSIRSSANSRSPFKRFTAAEIARGVNPAVTISTTNTFNQPPPPAPSQWNLTGSVGDSSELPILRVSQITPTTISTSITSTVIGSHEFKITGYSLAKGMGCGKYIASDSFMVGCYSWAIHFYPDGKSFEDNARYVSLFIALLASDETDVRALFELTLFDQSGRGNHKIHSQFERVPESGPYTLKYRGSSWGYKRFYERTALEASDYLKDDTLVIRCRVGVVTD